MNGFLIQFRNKINKIIKLNNEIAHERLPNTKQFQEPVAVKSWFCIYRAERLPNTIFAILDFGQKACF